VIITLLLLLSGFQVVWFFSEACENVGLASKNIKKSKKEEIYCAVAV
jgi:hypothetical protein